MKFPAFEVPLFGVFDSSVRFPRTGATEPRPVYDFEIEFFPEDCRGTAYIDQKKYPLLRGTLLCCKPGQIRHSDLPFRCRYLHLKTEDPELISALLAMPDQMRLENFAPLLRYFDELLSVPASRPLLFQGTICRILDLMIGFARAGKAPVSSAYLYREKLLEIEQYIRKNPAASLDLATLATMANLSPVHFHRIFTDFFRATPNEFVLQARLSEAKTRLIREDSSISRISADCGFSSQAYFSYKFKSAVGQTPLQYRKSMLSRLNLSFVPEKED